MKLSQNLFGTAIDNPFVVASGKWSWEAKDWRAAEKAGAGAITTKSFWPRIHEGNPEPTVVQTEAWTLNAVGLPDHGPEHSGAQIKDYLATGKTPLFVSIVGLTPEDIAENVRRIAPLKPAAFEVNLSSPTFLKLRGSFFDENAAEEMVAAACGEAKDRKSVV